MTEQESPSKADFGKRLQSTLIAIVVSLTLAFALRSTTVSSSWRMGISFFVFVVLDSVIYDRIANARYSSTQWLRTIGVALLGAIGMSWIVSL